MRQNQIYHSVKNLKSFENQARSEAMGETSEHSVLAVTLAKITPRDKTPTIYQSLRV